MKKTAIFDGSSGELPVKIVAWLLEEGYLPADHRGRTLKNVRQEDSIGILWSPPVPNRSYASIWKIFERTKSSVLIAQLSFVDAHGNDTKEWNMCIFGQVYIDLGLELSQGLAKEFKVDIRVTSHQCREPEKNRWLMILQDFVQSTKLRISKSA